MPNENEQTKNEQASQGASAAAEKKPDPPPGSSAAAPRSQPEKKKERSRPFYDVADHRGSVRGSYKDYSKALAQADRVARETGAPASILYPKRGDADAYDVEHGTSGRHKGARRG